MRFRISLGRWAIDLFIGREKQSLAATVYEEVLEEVFGEDVGLIVTPTISLN